MGITHLCENAHFTYIILQYTCFNCTCSYDKCVWDMSQYNKLSDIQYARFQILPMDLHFGLFWSAGIPTMHTEQFVDGETWSNVLMFSRLFSPNNLWVPWCKVNYSMTAPSRIFFPLHWASVIIKNLINDLVC